MLVLFLGSSLMALQDVSAQTTPETFRRENGLQPYEPPEWFLKGYFLASEKNPGVLFGTIRDFAEALEGNTTWLIEDTELERVKEAAREGRQIEYSLFLEAASPGRTLYWVFVVLPYETATDWYNGKRAYHGRKAEAYYGKTRDELEQAFGMGYKITGELRFLIEGGRLNPQIPEEAILKRTNCRPVLDLHTGRKP